jgi:hypothetical protein
LAEGGVVVSVGGVPHEIGSPSNGGAPQDDYTGGTAQFLETDLGNWQPGSSSDKWFWFTVTGKNASSAGYTECIDYISLIPQ